MSQRSEQAKITTQLSPLWLANMILTVMNSERNLPLLFYSLMMNENLQLAELAGQGIGRRVVGVSDQHMLDFGFGGVETAKRDTIGRRDAGGGLGGIAGSEEEYL